MDFITEDFDIQRDFDLLFLYDKEKFYRKIGYDEGYKIGFPEGYEIGKAELLAKIRQTFRARGMSPEEIDMKIEKILNAPCEEQLKKLHKGNEPMEKVAEMNLDLQREFDKLFLYDKGKLDREIAYDEGYKIGYPEGYEIGKAEGIEIGYPEGIEIGKTKLLAKIRQTLRAQGMSPEEIDMEIEKILNAPCEEQVTRKHSKKTKVSSVN